MSAFLTAGAITLATAALTGLWLASSKPAEDPAAPRRSTGPDAVTTSNEASANSR
ncbi:hypothetical protein [Streptomyces atratus]|uniref:hypothetical protein n=1 Tax=Streptomyces atratus TaxID=1893 RepID=UPI0021A3C11E|nr:hypothetical protein [Streptomyces atratus]MCT2543995.1 hypothetical protein [Streptomyces atratus]